MDYLPKDPAILPPEGRSVARNLVSSVNMLLRDEEESAMLITSWRAPEFDTLERFTEDITQAVERLEEML